MNKSALSKLMSQVADFSMPRIALLGAVLAGIYYSALFNDGSLLRQNITTLNTQIEEEKIKKVDTTRVLKKEEQMRADVSMLVKKYEDVKSKIPIEFLESELRIMIDQYANQFEIKTTKNQRTTKTKDFGSQPDSNLVEQIALEYAFTGSFFNIEKFANQISNLDKLVKIENFQFLVSNKQNSKAASREVTFTATIIGFKQSVVSISENKTDGKK